MPSKKQPTTARSSSGIRYHQEAWKWIHRVAVWVLDLMVFVSFFYMVMAPCAEIPRWVLLPRSRGDITQFVATSSGRIRRVPV
mmetsp:Transcript_140920/g.351369  ORF Transcript_140920/g.351369 Transcript_140920/m.351369 type:complete len:83 (-) Transcript_140920:136-384(-)